MRPVAAPWRRQPSTPSSRESHKSGFCACGDYRPAAGIVKEGRRKPGRTACPASETRRLKRQTEAKLQASWRVREIRVRCRLFELRTRFVGDVAPVVGPIKRVEKLQRPI